MLINQECDFEDCIDEECVDATKPIKSDMSKVINGCISAQKKSLENPMLLKLAGSPLNSEIRKSLKEVAYLTPNKSSRSMLL